MENRDTESFVCFEPYPGIKVCYHSISSFIANCLVEKDYNDFQTKKNRSFINDSFQTHFLSVDELETVNSFRSLKKQMEWMAGRFLVKTMVQRKLNNKTPKNCITVMHYDEGAPFIKDFPDLKISISHSGDYAGAALTTRENMDIGLDIEEIGKKPGESFMETAFTKKENTAMEMTAGEIFRHWTIKEAFLKYIKKGFNESLHHVEVISEEIFHNNVKAEVSIISKTIGNSYALSLVFGRVAH